MLRLCRACTKGGIKPHIVPGQAGYSGSAITVHEAWSSARSLTPTRVRFAGGLLLDVESLRCGLPGR